MNSLEVVCDRCGSSIDDKDIMLRVAMCESLARRAIDLDESKMLFPLCHDCWMKLIEIKISRGDITESSLLAFEMGYLQDYDTRIS